ncbi:nucleotide exchange factor GrpE [Chachezhania antarctica]|uniref:nucleotide exchange factor GrpE n=1 Tax=Chachezhania antarctica TaxID=2340860 RepID=UPI000EB4C394|nr:nucleotide exchange factor GrpE [Chachezhania antarctica]
MADPKKDDFLDDIADAEAEELAAQMAEGPEDAAGGTPTGTAGEDELAALAAERDQYKDRFVRALADAENLRKRADKERREAEQYGGSKLARDMLPVYDNMKRALDAATEEQKQASAALIEGIELTMRELLNVFSKHGIDVIVPQVGDRFDPQMHQAMFEAPVPGTKAGDIIQVAAEGFLLHDRLLRPAQVGVSSTPAG